MALDGYGCSVLGKDGSTTSAGGSLDVVLNALVPPACGVLPVQAWVTIMLGYNQALENYLLDASGLDITLVSPFMASLCTFAGSIPTDLSDNSLPLSEIMAVLALFQTSGAGSGTTIDLSGGSNAAPVMDTAQQSGVATFLLTDGVGQNTGGYNLLASLSFPGNSNYTTLDIFEQGDSSLDQSSVSAGGQTAIYLHTGDGPTAQQKADFISSTGLAGVVFSFDNTTKALTLTFSEDAMLPVSGQQVVTPGSSPGNSVVLALRAAGCNVVTN